MGTALLKMGTALLKAHKLRAWQIIIVTDNPLDLVPRECAAAMPHQSVWLCTRIALLARTDAGW